MLKLVKYKYDSCHYDKRIQPNRIYEVENEMMTNGYAKYAFRGIEGWHDARCFVPARPYMALAKEPPVVGMSMECYRFRVCEEGEKGFSGWKMERYTTHIIRAFYRCGEDTYVAFTRDEVYIVQIN